MIEFTIYGQPYSKANSRQLVMNKKTGKMMFIKSSPALKYAKSAKAQVSRLSLTPLDGDVEIIMTIYYPSNRQDLDESLILDILQGFAYKNDRQVKSKIILWALDKENPRAEIKIRKLNDGI